MRHTALPWSLDKYGIGIIDASGFEVVNTTNLAVLDDYHEKLGLNHWADSEAAYREISDEEREETAAFIMIACNSHYELVRLLKDTLVAIDTKHPTLRNQIETTLDKIVN